MKNQTKYSQGIETSPLNVNTNHAGSTLSGVATQKDQHDDVKKVKILVQAIYDIMKIYGYKDGGKNLSGSLYRDFIRKTNKDKLRLEDKYLEFVAKAGKGSWKDLFKYKINAFFSYVMEQEIPPAPKFIEEFPELLNPATISYGRGKRFVRNMDRKTLESFAQSIAQCKKGAPPVSPCMVREAEIKTFEHLTTARQDIADFTIVDGNFDYGNYSYPINRDTICYQLRRTVREIFTGKVPTWDELTKPFVPSSSSQYNFSRNAMGAIGAFKDNQRITSTYEGKTINFISYSVGPVQLKEELTELYGKAGIEDQERIDRDFENIMVKDTIGLLFNGEELEKLWKNSIYPELLEEALKEQPHTIVIGLPEPLKVRCITAGPPLTYTVLKPMQKWLWKTLKKYKCFRLIGEPVSEEIVMEQLGKLLEDEEFISGDYKASTDNLHGWVSECLLDALVECWLECYQKGIPRDMFAVEIFNFKHLMRKALTGHILMNPIYNEQYRKGKLTGDEPDLFRDQREGQLMGSIISFIFLCLANGAMCRYAMELSDFVNYSLTGKTKYGYVSAHLLINGDDCVFRGKMGKCFQIWKDITAFAGLESSVGKTFTSRKFLTINSCQYTYLDQVADWESASGMGFSYSYSEVKYVNLGLVYGQKKDGTRGKPFYRLGAISRDLFRTCPTDLYDRAFKIFLKENKKIKYKDWLDENGNVTVVEDYFGSLKNAHVPLYMPEWLGGIGLVPSSGKRKTLQQKVDRACATIIREELSQGKVRIATMSNIPEWKFHNLVSKDLDDYAFLDNQNFRKVIHFKGIPYREEERSLEDENNKLYTLMVVKMLLTHGLADLKQQVDYMKEDKILMRGHAENAKLWNTSRKSIKDSMYWRPMDEEDLIPSKKSSYLSCFDMGL